MFYATDHSKVHGGPLPAGSSFRPEDWEILAGFWHPVAFEADIGDKPVAQRLLDVDLVIYRSAEGISVAKDLCMHRGTKMSGGWISDGRIVCPMHGLEYDGSGRCRRIPSIEDPNARIPDKLRLEVYQSEVRYGIVWACLREEPLWPLPSWPHLDGGEMAPIHIDGGTWYASASRHVENFNDVSHFPWVHGATFGGEMDASFPLYEVSETAQGLHFELPYHELGNRFPDGHDELENRDVIYRYDLTFPFSTCIEVDVQGSEFVHYVCDTVCPVSTKESRIFQIMTDNSGAPDRDYWIADALAINDEDKALVEAQFPPDLPLDLREEVHIPADRMSLSYRKALANKFGLGAPVAPA